MSETADELIERFVESFPKGVEARNKGGDLGGEWGVTLLKEGDRSFVEVHPTLILPDAVRSLETQQFVAHHNVRLEGHGEDIHPLVLAGAPSGSP